MTAVAVLAAVALFISSCATGGTGARDEGPAQVESSSGSSSGSGSSSDSDSDSNSRMDAAAPSPAASVSLSMAAEIVLADPQVSAEVKSDLQPCDDNDYPVDVTTGQLTGSSTQDVVVNVLTCGDLIGIGSYVYRRTDGAYENVFKTEESPVYAQIDRGDLVVSRQVYEKGDAVSDPSGEYVITYRWESGRFVKKWDQYDEYSGGLTTATPSPVPTV